MGVFVLCVCDVPELGLSAKYCFAKLYGEFLCRNLMFFFFLDKLRVNFCFTLFFYFFIIVEFFSFLFNVL